MCKHCSLVPILRLVALVVLAIGVAACLVGFVSPFWAYYDPGLPCVPPPAGNASAPVTGAPVAAPTTSAPPLAAQIEGLWGRCDAKNYTLCTWFWDDNFKLERCFPSTCISFLLAASHPCMHVLYRCGLFLQISYVAWSVCLSVCLSVCR